MVGSNPDPQRLLVVEDDELIATFLTRGLQKHVELTIVGEGEAALALLRDRNSFDLVLCDLHLPDFTGFELRRRAVELDPTWTDRIAFMTGGTIDPEAQAQLALESDRCLDKPFTLSQLRSFLQFQGIRF